MNKHLFPLLVLALLAMHCTPSRPEPARIDPLQVFAKDMADLKDYFHIPGMGILVQQNGETIYEAYLGQADVDAKRAVDSATVFPIASLTKIYAAVAIHQLAAAGKLSLDDPIESYLPELEIGDSILVRHVLSHTSQGAVGQQFYYSYRFGWLKAVIEKAAGQSLEEYVQANILQPLALKNTFWLRDSAYVAAQPQAMAQPYFYDNGLEPGIIEYGVSSSAGLVSNLRDLAAFSRGLDDESLLSAASKDVMFKSAQEGLPYGYGIFSESYAEVELLWGYGQYDCYASLFLKVPEKGLTLILAGNNNLMSDPARLIYGKATGSLFVMSFLKNMVFNQAERPLFVNLEKLASTEATPFERDQLLAEALAASFMSRFDTSSFKASVQILEAVFQKYPNYADYADLNLMHTISFLKNVTFYRNLTPLTAFDQQFEMIGNSLLEKTPENPYLHIYLGTYYDRNGMTDQARVHFQQILNNANFSPFWYTQEAKAWLTANPE